MASKVIEFDATVDANELNKLLADLQAGALGAAKAINDALGGEVKKKLVIETQTDENGVKRLVAVEKDRLTAAAGVVNEYKKLQGIDSGSLTSLRQQVNKALQQRDAIEKIKTSTDEYGRKISQVNPLWDKQNQKLRALQRELSVASASGFWDKAKVGLRAEGFTSFLNGLNQITLGLQSASIVIGQVIGAFNGLVNALSNIQQFELTFKAIGATQGEAQAAFDETSRIALGLGTNLQAVRDTFQQLSPIVVATGGSINDVSAITEALSSRFAAFGLSGDKARRVLNGITQAFGKGRLQAEELTQQISEADPAFRIDLANAIGVSSKELGELVKNGEITDKVLLEVIPKLGKSALLFGRLGTSATDAANALKKDFKNGGITIEQFRNQLASLTQLNLEKAGTALKPLIDSLKSLQALFVDLGTVLVNSEAFRTLAGFVNALSTQFIGVAQTVGLFAKALFTILNVVLSVVNGFDSLLEKLVGFRPIVTLLAGLITAKLVVALVGLSMKGAAGLAVAGIRAVTIATATFATAGVKGLVSGIAGAVTGFVGFTKATRDQIAANFQAVTSIKARSAAIAQLRTIEASTGGLGGASGSVQLAAQAAGQRAVARTAAEAATSAGELAARTTAAGGAAGRAIGPIGRFGSKLRSVGAGLRGSVGSLLSFAGASAGAAVPLVGLGLAAVGLTLTLQEQYNELAKGKSTLDKFSAAYDGVAKRTNETIDRLRKAGESTTDFNTRLKGLAVTTKKGFDVRIGFKKAQKDFKEIEKRTTKTFKTAKGAVEGYNESLDTTGTQGLITAQRLAAAEQVTQEALDITRAKRDEMTDQATKGGTEISESNLKQLKAYQKNITALEAQRDRIKKLKEEASKKGIPIELDTNQGVAAIEGLEATIKGLQAEVILETDEKAFAKTQSKINGLAAELAFLKADRTKIKIDLEYKINTDQLKATADVTQGVIDNLAAEVELSEAINNLFVSRIAGAEQERSKNLEVLKERLEGEKKARDERMETLKESGAGEKRINQLKKEGRAADKKAAEEVKAVEDEIKAIQEQKKQQEAEGIRQKLAALPAQQEAERTSLQIAQELRRLELERLLATQQRLALEGQDRLTDLEGRRLKAVDRGDTQAAQDLQKRIDIQRQLLNNYADEERSIQNTIDKTRVLDGLERSTLDKKQEAQALNLKAQLAAIGQAESAKVTEQAAKGTAQAVDQTARATEAAAQRARGLATTLVQGEGSTSRLLRDVLAASGIRLDEVARETAAGYGAAASAAGDLAANVPLFEEVSDQGPRNLADAYQDARDKALGLGQATEDIDTSAVQLEKGVANTAEDLEGGVSVANDLTGELGNGATEAQRIANAIAGIDDVTVTVRGIPGLWTGGPTVAGQTYQVNELGQEGFLSAAGRLGAINKPKNALWRAPSSGTVIPAHIWSAIDAPLGGVRVTGRPGAIGSSGNPLARAVRAIQVGMTAGSGRQELGELARVQAHQARQIGKLASAVQDLSDKDWNIQVGVRNTGTSAFLDMVNHRL